MNDADIARETKLEWERILPKLAKHQTTLFAIYERDTRLYQRWRRRFLQFGYLKPSSKRKSESLSPRSYYRQWRAKHPEAAKRHCRAYWAKKLSAV